MIFMACLVATVVLTRVETADLVTFTEEILNGKTSFFVQCEHNICLQ